MSKKVFIALADAIREHNTHIHLAGRDSTFGPAQLEVLADFCRSQNSTFKRDRWLSYVAGECGPNGGAVKR